MRIYTVLTTLHEPSGPFYHLIIPRAVAVIQGTIAEQTVKIRIALMTRIKLTIFVCKKSA